MALKIASDIQTFSLEKFEMLCDELAKQEPIFNNILERYGYPPLWSRNPGFETLINIILEQQVSLSSALAAYHKLKEKLPSITPEAFLLLNDIELKTCYFSRQKIIYTRDLARRIRDGNLDTEALHYMADEDVIDALTQVKGIGRWTAQVYLMMVLHRKDCFPLNDIALVKSLLHEHGLSANTEPGISENISSQWQPNRTIAAYMLWHAYLSRRSKK